MSRDRAAHCSVVEGNCEAPAGFSAGDGYACCPEVRIPTCWDCGSPVCRAEGCSSIELRKTERRSPLGNVFTHLRNVRVCAICVRYP